MCLEFRLKNIDETRHYLLQEKIRKKTTKWIDE